MEFHLRAMKRSESSHLLEDGDGTPRLLHATDERQLLFSSERLPLVLCSFDANYAFNLANDVHLL